MPAIELYQVNEIWLLNTQQLLFSPRYKAAPKLVYSHFRFTTP